MSELQQEDLKGQYREINPGDVVTVGISARFIAEGCVVLSKSYIPGKILYTVAVPTDIESERPDDIGCLVNSLVFLNNKIWVRWENIDSVFIQQGFSVHAEGKAGAIQ